MKIFVAWPAFAFCIAICILGCGRSPVEVATPSRPSAQPSVANAGVVDSPTTGTSDLPADSTPGELPATEAPVDDRKSEIIDTPISNKTAIQEQTVALPPAEGLKATAPSTEQLDRWKQPEFEPVQLLVRHQSDEISFVSEAVSSTDGEWLVLGGEKLTLWKPLTDTPVATLWDLGKDENSKSVLSLAIDPTGTWIAAGDAGGTVRVWNLDNQKELVAKKLHNNGVVSISISDDGNEIATATYGKEIYIWQAKSLEQIKNFDVNPSGEVSLLHAGPNKLAVAGKSMSIWDSSTGEIHKTIVEDGYFASFARSADRAMLAVAKEDRVQFLKTSDLSISKELISAFAQNEILELTKDESLLWTANGSSIRCWDVASGKVVQVIDVNQPAVVGLDWLDDRKLLRVVSEDGVISYWGSVASGLSAGLKPIHAPINIPNNHSIPATALEMQTMVDLRTFPKPPNSIASSGEMTMIQIDSGNPIEDTKAFYRHVFGQRSWTELAGNIATPDYLTFVKNGFKVFVSISNSGTGRTSIYLASLGNVDLRALPRLKLPGFKLSYESDASVSYEVSADILAIETQLLRDFSAAGWIPYSRLNSSHSDDPTNRDIEFIKNAMTIRVSVQPKADDASKYNVQYTAFVAAGHLPTPLDCDFIECDATRPPALVVKTSLNLEDCHAFYDQSMEKLGWIASGITKSKDNDLRWLSYFRDQIQIQIKLMEATEGGTWIVVGEYAPENSWQLAKNEDTGQAAVEPVTTGIQAADVPIFKSSDATSVSYDKQQQQITIKLPKTSHVEIADFYAAKFAAIGWKEEPNGFRDEDYAFVTFTKDKASVQVRVNTNSLGTTIGISDDGLLWDKALPEEKHLFSYESWMRKKGHTASLKMLDQYIEEMRPLLAN